MDPPPPYTPLPDEGSQVVDSYPQQPPRPPLPPRRLQPASAPAATTATPTFTRSDVRSASQVSLVPVHDATKRTLLVIYIHGFMGNETSFQSFPAHLHNLLCVTMEPLGYLVHTKVYPKFKTRYNILVATENFSQWLSQFENETTDVVLLGHSMGGLLSADVALLKDYTGLRRHRLLGTISFDTPFLGMHPGVITAGLGSIFNPVKSPGEEAEPLYQNGGEGSSTTSLQTVTSKGSQVDEFYSKKPQRNFTVAIPKKEGAWDSTFHFINKYHSRLTQATGHYLMSHLEFGGCLADPMGLRDRYLAIRALEDGQPNTTGGIDRIRFTNYYTSSTGRTKETPNPPPTATPATRAFEGDLDFPSSEHQNYGADTAYAKELQTLRLGEPSSSTHKRNPSASSFNTTSSYGDMKHIPADPIDDDGYYHGPIALHIVETDDIPVADGHTPAGLLVDEKVPFDDDSSEDISRQVTVDSECAEKTPGFLEDPETFPVPDPPERPSTFDYSVIPDPIVRKVAEKEAARVWKRYEKAVRDHEKLVRDRDRMLEKLEKRKGKEVKGKEKEKGREEKERLKELRDREKERGKEEKDRLKGLRDLEKERRKEDKDKLKESRDLEKEKESLARDIDIEESEKLKEFEGLEKEKELLRLDSEIETRERRRELKQLEREKVRQQKLLEREKERQEREKERQEREKRREEKKRGKGKQENSQEQQELERLRKEQERMDAEYRRMNGIPEPSASAPLSPRNATPSVTPSPSSSRSHLPLPTVASLSKSSPQPKQKKKRERRFCILPSDKNDKCWVKVEMKGVDEVGAHCGLFFVGEVYERLVGDVAARIEGWVSEETSRRVVEQEGRETWGRDEKGSMGR